MPADRLHPHDAETIGLLAELLDRLVVDHMIAGRVARQLSDDLDRHGNVEARQIALAIERHLQIATNASLTAEGARVILDQQGPARCPVEATLGALTVRCVLDEDHAGFHVDRNGRNLDDLDPIVDPLGYLDDPAPTLAGGRADG